MNKYPILYHKDDLADFRKYRELWPKSIKAPSLYAARLTLRHLSRAPRVVHVELPIDKESPARNILYRASNGYSTYVVLRRPHTRLSLSDEAVSVFSRAIVVHPITGHAVNLWRKLCKV